MSTTLDRYPVSDLRHDLSAIRGNWLWFVILGVLMIILGFLALGSLVVATLATAIVLGVLLFAGGVFEVVGAFWSRAWSGFFLHLLSGILAIVVGVLFLRAPVAAVFALTLLLACLLLVDGIFRIITALSYRFSGWGWPLVGGIIDVILGVMIWMAWPEASLWVIGLFLGISLIFRGVNWIALGVALRALPRLPTV